MTGTNPCAIIIQHPQLLATQGSTRKEGTIGYYPEPRTFEQVDEQASEQANEQTGKKTRHPKSANSSDLFQTPPECADYLIPFLRQRGWNSIWECACGEGNLVEHFSAADFTVLATDTLPHCGEPYSGTQNFLGPIEELTPLAAIVDVIITNPPYSVKDQFIKRCIELHKPFALFLPYAAIGEQKRWDIYRTHPPQLIVLRSRTNFVTPSKTGKGAWQNTAWFCWGFNFRRDLNYLHAGESEQ